jgi:ABC-type lipoprotein export system ATPase subunit
MAEGLALEASDLRATGDEGRPILTLDALSLAAGQCLGVRGPSGAGKTTLILALAGLLPRVVGRIAWSGVDIAALRPGDRRAFRLRHVGLVFQDFPLFEELTPADNAAIAALFSPRRHRAAIRSRSGQLLEQMRVPERRAAASTLSGGERQRVAIARALATDPSVVLADEPTASLHRDAADRVIEELIAQTRGGGRTLVAASHDERLLDRMDQVVTLEGGRRMAA